MPKEVYVPMKSVSISIKAILGRRFYFHRHIGLQHILISPGDLDPFNGINGVLSIS